MMNKELNELKQLVDEWRQQSPRATRVPREIKQKTVDLLPYFKIPLLANHLGFGRSTLAKWRQQYSPAAILPAVDFIELKPTLLASPTKSAATEKLIQINFVRAELEFKAMVNPSQFQQLFLQ